MAHLGASTGGNNIDATFLRIDGGIRFRNLLTNLFKANKKNLIMTKILFAKPCDLQGRKCWCTMVSPFSSSYSAMV